MIRLFRTIECSHKSLWKDEKRKPITVKGLLDNGSRLSPPNNDDYMVRSRETTEVTAAANFHTLLKRVVLPLSLSLHQLISSRGGVESNEFQIDFNRIFRIIFHLSDQSNHKFPNRTNFERIQHLKNLTPPNSWSQIEWNEFRINFHRIFRIFFALSN